MCDVVAETDSAGYDSEAGVDARGRRLSGELISMKDFLTSNKVQEQEVGQRLRFVRKIW